MKTTEKLNEIIRLTQKEIKELLSEDKPNKRKINKALKELEFYRNVLIYIELSPNQSFVKDELEKYKRIRNRKQKDYPNWLVYNTHKEKPDKLFQKEFIKPLTGKIKTLEFILDE